VVRRSFEHCPQQGPLHLVSAWATENNVVLAQLRVDEKANEIVAVPERLEQLDVTGCVVTADALNCQVKTAARILEKGGDYLLAIKGNQPGLYDDIVTLFDDLTASGERAYTFRQDKSVASGHGRIETRHLWVIDDSAVLKLLPNSARWPNLASVIRIRSERRITAGPPSNVGKAPSLPATISPVPPLRHTSSIRLSADTGVLKMLPTGCSTSPSAKTMRVFAATMAPKTSLSYAVSRLVCSSKTHHPSSASKTNASRLLGTTTISFTCSPR
jgi:predicted transposase YbfD/YdcC